jgi:ectoine hydroxylase-related dioxygenase (phytanoyl-CoA dioxygenase family)
MTEITQAFDAELDRHYPITKEQIEFFKLNGFIRLKDVFSPELLKHFGDIITRQTIALNTQHLPIEERSTYNKAFLQIMNLWRHDATIREFVFGKRVARIAAELLEVKGVRIYHDQSLYKESRGGITPTHADQFYWPLSSDRTITAWIPLQPVSQDMGPLAFYAQSQHFDYGRDLEISDESERQISSAMQEQNFELVDYPFDLGEISLHLGWTFHRAGANTSNAPRSVMTMIYIDQDIKLVEPCNKPQQNDWDSWCPGVKIGKVVASPINPVVFSA